MKLSNKVYVVMYRMPPHPYENIEGVFSTKEKAEEFYFYQTNEDKLGRYYLVTVYDLDSTNPPDVYRLG